MRIAFEIRGEIHSLFPIGIPTFEGKYKVTQLGIVMMLEPKAEPSVRPELLIRSGIVEYELVTSTA